MNFTHFYSLVLFMTSILVNIFCDQWYAGRHQKSTDKNVVTVAYGPEKGIPITFINCGITSVSRRIVGGMTAKVGQFPWSVLLLGSGKPFCGGAILNERWILTAAHCFKKHKVLKLIKVKVGMINSNEGTEYGLEKLIKHKNYNTDEMQISDIALLKTTEPIQMETNAGKKTINGVCLPNKMKEPRRKTLTVSGWGRTSEDGDPSRDLKLVNLDLIDHKECKERFAVEMVGFPEGYTIYNSQMCTFTRNKDACQGDSGGPAIETVDGKAYLVGVVSYGVGCATDFPGVYTKVSHYVDWIAQNVD